MLSLSISTTDPMYNLALEEWLFTQTKPDSQGFFLLWHNKPSIIVGRHQNTFQEINQELVTKYTLPVVRRMTGGGAVYHDLGNVNYSFIRPLKKSEKGEIDFKFFLSPIVNALQELGLNAQYSSRNDITINERKVSGSAQLRRNGNVLHHGTLLVNLDLDMLTAVLTVSPDKYLSKGINSVRSRVTNIQDLLLAQGKVLSMEDIKAHLIQCIAPKSMTLDNTSQKAILDIMQEKYANYAWNYGRSPAFTEKRSKRFNFGLVQCHFLVQKGMLKETKIYGDFFSPDISQYPIENLEQILSSISYTTKDLSNALRDVPLEKYFSGADPIQLQEFFCNF